jgi:hypothetical protein
LPVAAGWSAAFQWRASQAPPTNCNRRRRGYRWDALSRIIPLHDYEPEPLNAAERMRFYRRRRRHWKRFVRISREGLPTSTRLEARLEPAIHSALHGIVRNALVPILAVSVRSDREDMQDGCNRTMADVRACLTSRNLHFKLSGDTIVDVDIGTWSADRN